MKLRRAITFSEADLSVKADLVSPPWHPWLKRAVQTLAPLASLDSWMKKVSVKSRKGRAQLYAATVDNNFFFVYWYKFKSC